MKVNTNDPVTFVLTEYGAAMLNAHKYGIPYQQTHRAGERVTMPLWEMAQVFGPCLYMGNPKIPFQSNTIEVKLP